MEERVNLHAIRMQDAKLAGKDEPEEVQYLFYYTLWTLIRNKDYETLTDREVELYLKDKPRVKIVFFRLKNSKTPKPAILKKHKHVTQEVIGGHEEVSQLIFSVTGVLVPEIRLQKIKTVAEASFERLSLVDKLRKFEADHKQEYENFKRMETIKNRKS